VKRSQIILLAVVVIVDLAFIWWHYGLRPRHRSAPAAAAPAIEFRAALPGGSDTASPSASAAAASPGSAGSPLAADLNSPDSDAMHDVKTVHALLRLYLRALHHRQGPPIGDDIDLAHVLTGHNPMHFVIIPAGNPALSADGHLIDRWGTPYFIHPIGYGVFEIRSAGPDRKLFTGDDIVDGPAAGSAHTEIPEAATPP
jgi:hypothetical protein